MTPVVVSYCWASANIEAIPERHSKWDDCVYKASTELLTYSPIKVRYNCRQRDHYQLYSFTAVTPLNREHEHIYLQKVRNKSNILRILWVVGWLRP